MLASDFIMTGVGESSLSKLNAQYCALGLSNADVTLNCRMRWPLMPAEWDVGNATPGAQKPAWTSATGLRILSRLDRKQRQWSLLGQPLEPRDLWP